MTGESTMKEFVIYRHGWNESNQSPGQGLPEKMAVLRIEAVTPEEACLLAQRSVVLLGDQFLSAEPAPELDAKEDLLNRPPNASLTVT